MREKVIENGIRRALEAEGWLTAKAHGNRFQKGWPDLYCHHPEHGERWIEVKTPSGKLTPDQRRVFPRWEAAGVRIWVLDSTGEIHRIWGDPNWREWE